MVGSRYCELNRNDHLLKADLNGENSIDITNEESVNKFFKNNNVDVAILFSAFTDVDAAETQKGNKNGTCWNINVNGSKFIQKACQNKKVKLVFISTETVFDGIAGPYKESDKTGPDEKLSWYGLTKKIAEEQIAVVKNNIIIRICYPYRSNFEQKTDFARSIIHKYDDGSIPPMFSDQVITPTFIDDLTLAAELLIGKDATGIYHVASPKETTPYEFAEFLLNTFRRNISKLQKGSILQFLKKEQATPRPIKGGLKVEKITKEGFSPTNWKKGIENIYSQSKGQLI